MIRLLKLTFKRQRFSIDLTFVTNGLKSSWFSFATMTTTQGVYTSVTKDVAKMSFEPMGNFQSSLIQYYKQGRLIDFASFTNRNTRTHLLLAIVKVIIAFAIRTTNVKTNFRAYVVKTSKNVGQAVFD